MNYHVLPNDKFQLFVKKRLIEFELIPLKHYPGFERLFTDNQK